MRLRQLIALWLLVASGADAQPLRIIELPSRPEPRYDLSKARENSALFAEQQKQHAAPVPAARARQRLEQLGIELGEARSLWSRCTFLTVDELFESKPAVRRREQAALEAFGSLRQDLGVELDAATRALAADPSPLAPLHRQELEVRRAELAPLLDDVGRALASRVGTAGDRWGEFLRSCVWADGRTALAEARARLDAWGASRGPPVLGVALTYVNSDVNAPALTPVTTAPIAYLSRGATGTTLEDTTKGREIVLSPELTAMAAQLGTVKAAADFVRNEVRLDWYHGVMKDSAATFTDRSGNDAELAGLLIALLRSQDVPARYVTGTIELPLEQVAELMGWLTPQEVNLAGFTLEPARRTALLAALTASGIPYQVTGGAVRMAHVWVEGYVPYGDYRGYGGQAPKQWVAIEPSFTGRAKYAFTPGVIDVLADMGETPQSLTSAYLASAPGVAFMAFVRARVEAHLAATRPGTTWNDVQSRITQRAEALEFLPGSLPFKVVGTDGEHAFLPGAWLHHVRVTARDGVGPLVDVLLPLHQVASHRLVWTYKPATPADADLIAQAGGLYAAHASAVQLLPVLRLDGQVRAVGLRSLGLGAIHAWALELLLPGGAVKRVENSVIAGNLVSIGLSTPRNSYTEPAQFQTGDQDGPAPRRLYAIATAYANGWTQAEEELAAILGTRLVRRTPGVVLVENQLLVEESLGVRTRVVWKGLQMDADLRTATAVSTTAGRGAAFMRLSGFQGSFLEAKALVDGTGEESVSATSVLQHAAQQGVAVLTIDASNEATMLPRVTAPADVLREISDAIARGREVKVPELEIDVRDWTGTAFIVRDVATEEGGYFLSGVVSGGATVVSAQFWSDQALVSQLTSPGSPQASMVLSDIARIVYLPAGGALGQMGGAPLRVRVAVTTLAGQPVDGAKVTFERIGTTQPLFVKPLPNGTTADEIALDVSTLGGVAAVDVRLDTDTRRGAMLVKCTQPTPCDKDPGGGYDVVDEFFGVTQVMAKVERPPPPEAPPGTPPDFIRLALPIFLAAKPGVPTNLTVRHAGQTAEPAGIQVLGSLLGALGDQWHNPLANRRVVWTQGGAGGRFFVPDEAQPVHFLDPTDTALVATLELHSDTSGITEVGYVTPAVAPPQFRRHHHRHGDSGDWPGVDRRIDDSAEKTLRISAGTALLSVQGSDFEVPVLLQAFEKPAGASAWTRILRNRPGVTRYRGVMRVFGLSGANAATTTEAREATENLGAVPLDDDNTVAFWPQYVEQIAGQRNLFSMEILEGSGDNERRVCCDEGILMVVPSLPLEVEPMHFPVGGTFQPVAAAASAGDLSVGFRMRNFGSQPVYMRLGPSAAQLMNIGGPDIYPRQELSAGALNHDLFAVPANVRQSILFPVKDPAGGVLTATFEVPEPSSGLPDDTRQIQHFVFRQGASTTETNTSEVTILPVTPFLQIAGTTPANLTFPVRNPRSQAGTAAQAHSAPPAPSDQEDEPIAVPGALTLYTNASGLIEIRRNGLPVVTGEVEAAAFGVLAVTQLQPPPPAPPQVGLLSVKQGALVVALAPGGPVADTIDVTLTSPTAGPLAGSAELETRISSLGALPLGQTMVKGVNLADGHLYKSMTDLVVPGRGVPLEFTRSYSSGGSERSPLGVGWTHNYRVQVSSGGLSSAPATAGQQRWVVSGAQGGGQVFTCTATVCTPQRGYHGKLTQLDGGFEFRTKGGVKYLFEPMPGQNSPKYRLKSITDTVTADLAPAQHQQANVTTLEYGDARWDNEATRVYDAHAERFLDFSYARTPRGKLYLKDVQLYRNTNAPDPLDAGEAALDSSFAQPLGVCLSFEADINGNLKKASRGASCLPDDPARFEHFEYDATAPTDELKSNLTVHTDYNGNETIYEYMDELQQLEGEGHYIYFAGKEKQERIKEVVEQLGVTTRFTYKLIQPSTAASSNVALETRVSSPRSAEGVPDTVYTLEPYGTTASVARPLSPGTPPAVTRQKWNLEHLLEEEVDARSRITRFVYDGQGNLIERRTTVQPAGMGMPALQRTADSADVTVSQSVEKWEYDPVYSRLECHIDPEGRARQDSVQLGLTIESRRLSTRVARSALEASSPVQNSPSPPRFGATSDCKALTQTSTADITTRQEFVGVNSSSAPFGAKRGDLAQRFDGRGNRFRVTEYDDFGNPRETLTQVDASNEVQTSNVFDDRSRLASTVDFPFGHHTEYRYDTLDRRVLADRRNSQGDSLGMPVWTSYYPGGQVFRETFDLDGQPAVSATPPSGPQVFTRVYTLDELNRVSTITETQQHPVTPVNFVTQHFYDKASNRERTIDRRGVVTRTRYDFADRPTEVLKDGSTCASCEPGDVGVSSPSSPSGVVATFRYDDIGNTVAQTNAQGQETTFGIDGLYRVVTTTSPLVPGESLPRGTLKPWTSRRRFELTGAAVRDEDGNTHATVTSYDVFGRVIRVTDAEGRIELRDYDGNDNLRCQSFATAPLAPTVTCETSDAAAHRIRRTSYDGLNRPLDVTESVKQLSGGPHLYTTAMRYDDAAHEVATKDPRGLLTRRRLDDLDRLYEEVVDDASFGALLTRSPTAADCPPALCTPLQLTTKFRFDGMGSRISVEDALGRTTIEVNDGLKRVRSRALPMGFNETFSYDGEGNVISHKDVRDVVRATTYDALGRARRRFVKEGSALVLRRETVYVDAPTGGLSRRLEQDAISTHPPSVYLFDGLGRDVEVTDSDNKTQTWAYDAVVKREELDKKGFRTTLEYDRVNRLRRQREFELAAGSLPLVQQTFYEDAIRTVRRFDRTGIETVVVSDGLGRVEKTTRQRPNPPEGTAPATAQEELISYNANGQPVSVRDANLNFTTRVFDGAGRKRSETVGAAPEAVTTALEYDSVGNVVQSSRGRVAYDVRTTYDELNRPVRIEDGAGNVTYKACDGAGNVVCMKAPKGTGSTYPHSATVGPTRSAVEQAACSGRFVTRYAYEEEGNLSQLVDAQGGVFSYAYDAQRNLIAKQDARLSLTTFVYDVLNRRTREFQHLGPTPCDSNLTRACIATLNGVAPGSALPAPPTCTYSGGVANCDFTAGALTWATTYDPNGNVDTTIDPKGQSCVHQHGLLNRLQSQTYLFNPQLSREYPSVDSLAFTYTPNGTLQTATETARTSATQVETTNVSRTFDALERMDSQTRFYGSSPKTTLFGYDVKGNRTSVTDFTGASTVYQLDSVDRVKLVTTPTGNVAINYFADGLPKSARYTAGSTTLTQQRCYDNASRLTMLVSAVGLMNDDCSVPAASSTLRRFAYSFDANSNRTRQDETLGTAPAEVSEYGFDELDRLVATVEGPDAKLYQLDVVGNRTGEKKTTAAAARALGLTAAAFLALAPADTLAHMRGDFNRADWLTSRTQLVPVTGGGTTAFTHDSNGNITLQDGPAGTREYRYDSRNTLTAAFEGGSELGRYAYDWQRSRVSRTAQGQQVEYVLDGKHVLNELDAAQPLRSSTRRYHYGPNRPLAVADSSGARWLINDGLGSVSDEVLATGSIFTRRQYSAWGEYRNSTAPAGNEVKLGYTGMQFDPETGLTHSLGPRLYNASLGIWLQRDDYEGDTRNAPSLHRFAFTHNNPLRYTDTGGYAINFPLAIGGAIVGGLAGAAYGYFSEGGNLDKALAYGLGGAVVGGLAGLTLGASLSASSAAGGTASTALYAWGAKGAAGVVVDASIQLSEQRAGVRTELSVERSVVAFAAGTLGAPGVSTELPGLAPAVVATLGTAGVVGGAQMMEEGVRERSWAKAVFGPLYMAAGAAGLGSLRAPPPSRIIRVSAAETRVIETPEGDTTRVGRWMSQAEFDAMVESKRVIAPENLAGATHVTVPPNPEAFTPPPESTVFAEFDVPNTQLRVHDPGKGWGRVFGPGSLEARQAQVQGRPVPKEMPPATNVEKTIEKVTSTDIESTDPTKKK